MAQAAKEKLGYDNDKKKNKLAEPIKSLGTHMVDIKLHAKVTGQFKVVVTEAK